jgi:hypothetical protein
MRRQHRLVQITCQISQAHQEKFSTVLPRCAKHAPKLILFISHFRYILCEITAPWVQTPHPTFHSTSPAMWSPAPLPGISAVCWQLAACRLFCFGAQGCWHLVIFPLSCRNFSPALFWLGTRFYNAFSSHHRSTLPFLTSPPAVHCCLPHLWGAIDHEWRQEGHNMSVPGIALTA